MSEDYLSQQPSSDEILERIKGFGSWFEIDLDHIAFNLRNIRSRVGVELMPVVKNDSYGHGLLPLVAILVRNGVKWVMVARLAEALVIKRYGFACDVVNMDALYTDEQFRQVVEKGITQVVYTLESAQKLEDAAEALNRRAGVFVKVDTGLRRVGVSAGEAVGFMEALSAMKHLDIRGTFSTFMQVPDQDREMLGRFLAVFDALESKGIDPGFRSMASSNAILHYPESWLDMVRPAMTLFGVYPEAADREVGLSLRQALVFKARVEYLKWVEAGDSVTYFGKFTASKRMRIATLHTGFYDAIPRELANKGRIRVGKEFRSNVGSVSLNHYLFDATGSQLEIGDVVEVIGRDGENDLVTTAQSAGWMVYSLLNHLNPFTPRVYYERGEPVAILERSVDI